jgi:hypothetical protein
MEIAIAQFLVVDIGADNLPYYHQHVWPTIDWNHAIVELVDYQRVTEQEKHVKMHCFKWWVEERADIGI